MTSTTDGGRRPATRRASVLADTLEDRRIRRITLAFAGFATAEYGVWVAVLVFAYQRGGAGAAAAVAVAQLVPAAVAAPLLARAADRRCPAAALRRGYRWQCIALAATATLLVADMPAAVVYLSAIVAATAVTTTRPAQAALVPTLIGTGERLTAFNVAAGWVDSVSLLAGPAIAGVMIEFGGTQAAIGSFAVALAVSAWLVAGVAPDQLERGSAAAAPDASSREPGVREAIRDCPGLATLVAVVLVEYLVIGILDVIVVVLSLDVLALGPAGAGYLNAALGAGAIAGSMVALSLIGRPGLVAPLLASVFAWAVTIAALGAWPTVAGSFLLLASAGTARSLLDVSARTLMLRLAPATSRGRVFGLVEGSITMGLAVGSMLVPVLLSLGGPQLVLLTAGALLAATGMTAAPGLLGLERAGWARPPNLIGIARQR